MLILAGDIGTGSFFGECLQLFADLPCRKALVPGNHDLWVRPEDRHDSLSVYQEDLAAICQRYGFHYLDQAPLLLPEADLGIIGSINWYDYSWSRETLKRDYPGEEERLFTKQFTRGRHNDVNFVRWPLDDVRFTARVVDTLALHLRQALEQVDRVIVVTHHPPMRCISFPEKQPPLTLDDLLWEAFGGNRALEYTRSMMVSVSGEPDYRIEAISSREIGQNQRACVEELLARYAARIPFAFCGHTHRARQAVWQGIRGYNVGGDYHFKRLLWLHWPSGSVAEHQFGDEAK